MCFAWKFFYTSIARAAAVETEQEVITGTARVTGSGRPARGSGSSRRSEWRMRGRYLQSAESCHAIPRT